MSEAMNKWKDYKPTQAGWFWSCAGVCVLTMILGFTWGGWVTGGTAQPSGSGRTSVSPTQPRKHNSRKRACASSGLPAH